MCFPYQKPNLKREISMCLMLVYHQVIAKKKTFPFPKDNEYGIRQKGDG